MKSQILEQQALLQPGICLVHIAEIELKACVIGENSCICGVEIFRTLEGDCSLIAVHRVGLQLPLEVLILAHPKSPH